MTALRIFHRPALEHKLKDKGAELKALIPGLKLIGEKEPTEEEKQLEQTMNRVCEALTEVEEAAEIRDLAQEAEWTAYYYGTKEEETR